MLKLTIGNKRYSSWSFRPWILMKQFDIAFEENVVPLYTQGAKEILLAHSPAGKAPCLTDGKVTVWDSLAIIEYLAERYPVKAIWPRDTAARAHARSLACEMHSGFAALRNQCCTNFARPPRRIVSSEETLADIARIDRAWADARERHRDAGAFLFGPFGAVDAMFAPVVSRFDTYKLPVSDAARSYMESVKSLPAWREWHDAAAREEWRLPQFESAGDDH